MKASGWYAHFPGGALDAIEFFFDGPVPEREARAKARRFWWGAERQHKRLPSGTELWPVVDCSERDPCDACDCCTFDCSQWIE